MKLLAYLLYRKQHALEIEKGVGQRHKPDLVAQNPVTGQVQLWIDCGQIETDRLGRIVAKNRHAEVVVVKATAREAERYAAVAARDVTGHATVLGFDDGFTERFVELLRGTNTVEVVCLEETIRIVLNGEALESARQACSCRA
nr:YaeQ family protein [Armatimonas rosea]